MDDAERRSQPDAEDAQPIASSADADVYTDGDHTPGGASSQSQPREMPIRFNRPIVVIGLVGYSSALVLAARRWDLPAIGLVAALVVGLALLVELVAKALFGILFRENLFRQGNAIRVRSAISAAFVATAVARLAPAGGALSPSAMAWAVRAEDEHSAGAALRATMTSYGGLLLLTAVAITWGDPIGSQADRPLVTVFVVLALVVIGSLNLIGGRWLGRVVSSLPRFLRRHFGPTATDGRITIREIGLVLVRIVLEATVLWLVLAAFDVDLSAGQVMATFGTAKVLGSLPITPGGIGLVEGGMLGVLTAMGFSSTAVVAPVLVYQLLDYWMVATIGVLIASGRTRRPVQPSSGTD